MRRILLVVLLIVSFLQVHAKWKYMPMKVSEQRYIENRLDSLQLWNSYFKLIYEELDACTEVFLLSLSDDVNKASFMPGEHGGVINFASLKDVQRDQAVFEEFFHAFQYRFYALPVRLKEGGSNIEYEAKLFRAIIAIEQGLPMGETPSQKGLLLFVLSVLNKQGVFEKQKFSRVEQGEYISCVRHFQEHWLKRNIAEGTQNIYQQKVVSDWQPHALFYVVTKVKRVVK